MVLTDQQPLQYIQKFVYYAGKLYNHPPLKIKCLSTSRRLFKTALKELLLSWRILWILYN